MKPSIILFSDWFEPAYKAGGPIRSCVNFVQQMKDDYELYVFTGSRDLNQAEDLPGILVNAWQQYEAGVKVYYATPDKWGFKDIRKVIHEVDPDFIYLNSVFSKSFTIYPLLAKRFGRMKAKVVLSPRGMLRPSALNFKSNKKQLFLSVFRLFGIHKRIRFLATDLEERDDIERLFGDVDVMYASNFAARVPGYKLPVTKTGGSLSVIFIGRIHPIKNLDILLNALKGVRGNVDLTIVGVLENTVYWQSCSDIIKSLPATIKVNYRGDVPYHELAGVIANQHLFSLPTKGENFGHAIFEALSAGKPVLISDQTPWKELEAAKAGWELPLARVGAFTEKLQDAINWDQQQYNEWSKGAWQKANSSVDQTDLKARYKKIFN